MTISERVKEYLPESGTIDVISDMVDHRVADALALYDFEPESSLTTKQQIMISLEAVLMLIPAIIDYYKSRITSMTVKETSNAYADRMKGLTEMTIQLREQLNNVRDALGYGAAEPPFELKKAGFRHHAWH
ncbi:MAG: hypothetical protein KBA11_07820 [Sedimentibacter sp.]|nr:hypothetical protein [Sedimentibacter sp.]